MKTNSKFWLGIILFIVALLIGALLVFLFAFDGVNTISTQWAKINPAVDHSLENVDSVCGSRRSHPSEKLDYIECDPITKKYFKHQWENVYRTVKDPDMPNVLTDSKNQYGPKPGVVLQETPNSQKVKGYFTKTKNANFGSMVGDFQERLYKACVDTNTASNPRNCVGVFAKEVIMEKDKPVTLTAEEMKQFVKPEEELITSKYLEGTLLREIPDPSNLQVLNKDYPNDVYYTTYQPDVWPGTYSIGMSRWIPNDKIRQH